MLPDVIATNPALLGVLLVVVVGVLAYQRTLSWPEYKSLHALKRGVLPIIDRRTSWFVVSDKGYRDDDEYLGTLPAPVTNVARELSDAGGTFHLINSIKRRPLPDGGHAYSAAHLVWFHGGFGGSQTEAYLFSTGDGSTDVYAHHEPSVTDPDAHLSGAQTDGDPRDVVRSALPKNALTDRSEGE